MGVDGLPDALDAAVVVHGRHDLVEQLVPVKGQDMKSEDFAIGLIDHGLEPATGIPDRKGPGALDWDAPHRHVVALLAGLGLRQTYGGEGRIAEDDAWHHPIVNAAPCPLYRIASGDGQCTGSGLLDKSAA